MNPQIKLEVGDKAPDFVSVTQNGEKIELQKLIADGEKVLLVFYPGDDTPGCTKQLCGVRDIYKEYQSNGVRVLGVNHADSSSHQDFIDKFNYQFDIIVDEGKEIIQKYGAEKKFFNNIIVKRGVILIGKDMKILYKHWGQQDNNKVLEVAKNN